MHTPTKKQWQTVIDNFEKILPKATLEQNLRMTETRVNRNGYKCGTIHCVGGWYALATMDTSVLMDLDFRDGADQMARDLGFENHSQLENWASDHNEIWGNRYGGGIFCDADAYDNASTIQEVVEYLKGVRDRSPDNEITEVTFEG